MYLPWVCWGLVCLQTLHPHILTAVSPMMPSNLQKSNKSIQHTISWMNEAFKAVQVSCCSVACMLWGPLTFYNVFSRQSSLSLCSKKQKNMYYYAIIIDVKLSKLYCEDTTWFNIRNEANIFYSIQNITIFQRHKYSYTRSKKQQLH